MNLPSTVRKRITRNLKANSDPLRTAYKETVYKVKSLIKIGISKPILGKLKDHLKSKSASCLRSRFLLGQMATLQAVCSVALIGCVKCVQREREV